VPFVIAAAAGLVAGLALGGRPDHLLQLRLRAWPLLLLPLAWRAVQLVTGDDAPWQAGILPYVFPVELMILVVFAGLNWRVAAVPVIGAGAALNALVVSLNGGRMPIPLNLVRVIGGAQAAAHLAAAHNVGSYTVLGPATRLPWLADVLLMPGPLPRALSAGDLLLMVGLAAAITLLLLNKTFLLHARRFQ
jgi:uncharacterized protein DUF5317